MQGLRFVTAAIFLVWSIQSFSDKKVDSSDIEGKPRYVAKYGESIKLSPLRQRKIDELIELDKQGKRPKPPRELPPFPPDDLPNAPIDGWPPSGGGGKTWASYMCGSANEANCEGECTEPLGCLATCFMTYDAIAQKCITVYVCFPCEGTTEGPGTEPDPDPPE